MDRIEKRAMQFVGDAKRLESVKRPRMRLPVLTKYAGHAHELRIRRLGLQPFNNGGLKAITMWAAVPKNFPHLDFVSGLDRLALRQACIFDPFGVVGTACSRH